MTANASLERIFFNYIIKKKPFYFKNIEPYYFSNPDIQFVYTVCREEHNSSKNPEELKPKKIVELVRIQDKDKKISMEVLKALLTIDLDQYGENEDWINQRLEAWRISNAMKSRILESVEYIRNLDTLSYEKVVEVSNKIKEIINDSSTMSMADEDLGSDFDDPDNHVQDTYGEKVTTGYDTMNKIMNGGFDKKTLNILMGETNVGKSLWLQNLAANAADSGLNVVYISLEMSEKKVLKRLGSMRLKIPVTDYDELSKDKEYIQRRIADLKAGASTGNQVFSNNIGKIFVKEFPANSCTDQDIDQYCKSLQEKKGIKIGLIVIDYLTIMGLPKGSNIENNLYQRGKNLAEGVRALGYKYECPVVTAMQVSKDAWSASDINLNSVPESKAIAETADTFWAIIRNPEMKRKNLYRLKVLKLRDGDFTYEQIMFDLNVKYLTVERDRYLEPSQAA
jgi:replicative DNA helicase